MESKYIRPKKITTVKNMAKDTTVITVTGAEELKKNCRYFNKEWYKKGDPQIKDSGDIYRITSLKNNTTKWYRVSTNYLVFDYRLNMYALKTDLEVIVENGIVGLDENSNPIFGTFSQDNSNPSTTLVNIKGEIYICLEERLIRNSRKFKEAIFDGIYYERNALPALRFTEPVSCSIGYKNSLPYDSKGITNRWMRFHKDNYKPHVFNQVEAFHSIIKDLTFGVEFETVKGVIPEPLCKELGLIPLRDGSVAGLEYVTIPYKGKLGIQALIDSVNQLKRRTRFDNSCSLHIHIGNIPRTEEFFIALYKVLFTLQEEIYDMFPLHKLKNLGVKKKHYTKPLPQSLMFQMDNKIPKNKITENFKHIFRFLSMSQDYSNYGSLSKVEGHPSDPHGTSKWNIRTRYYWVNFIPLLFGNKQTIEFRIHTPTTDINKVMNYLFICTSIINYTKKHVDKIVANSSNYAALKLEDVICDTFPSEAVAVRSDLINYIDYRKQFITHATSKGDLIANENDFKHANRNITWSRNVDKTRMEDNRPVAKKRVGHLIHDLASTPSTVPVPTWALAGTDTLDDEFSN
jgi:hypothetical protein